MEQNHCSVARKMMGWWQRQQCGYWWVVKTRRSLKFGTPGMAVTYAKQQKIRTTALHYLQQCGGGYNKIAFDVIEIVADDGKAKLRHLQNCF